MSGFLFVGCNCFRGFGIELAQGVAWSYDIVDFLQDGADYAAFDRVDFLYGLVGMEFDDWLADVDGLSGLLEPPADRSFKRLIRRNLVRLSLPSMRNSCAMRRSGALY